MNGRREFALSRRALLVTLGGLAAAPRLAAQTVERLRVVGYLSGGQGPEWLAKVLATRGYVEGRNLRIETRVPPDWESRS